MNDKYTGPSPATKTANIGPQSHWQYLKLTYLRKIHCLSAPPSLKAWISRRWSISSHVGNSHHIFASRSVWNLNQMIGNPLRKPNDLQHVLWSSDLNQILWSALWTSNLNQKICKLAPKVWSKSNDSRYMLLMICNMHSKSWSKSNYSCVMFQSQLWFTNLLFSDIN